MKELEIMAAIQAEKAKEINAAQAKPLDAEGAAMAEHKRITFDVTVVNTDPLR